MADQGKWFKLWCAALRDDDLENLTIHQWFAWARFGAHMKEQGKNGKLRVRKPGTVLVSLMRVKNFAEVVEMIKTFPNYTIEEGGNVTDEDVTLTVTCNNWNKYQGDFSGDRVRKFRERTAGTDQDEKRQDKEEKKKDIPPGPPPGAFSIIWEKYPRREGQKAALRHFQASVKTMKDWVDINNALDNYMLKLRRENVEPQFVKMGATWFNNWRDYISYNGTKIPKPPTVYMPPLEPDKPMTDDEQKAGLEFAAQLKAALGGKR